MLAKWNLDPKSYCFAFLFAFLTFNNFAIADETPRINKFSEKNACSIKTMANLLVIY